MKYYAYYVFLSSVLRLLVTANVAPNSPTLATLRTEALHSSEMSIIRRATQRNIPEDGVLHDTWLLEAAVFHIQI
jgi:hypothetical protein